MTKLIIRWRTTEYIGTGEFDEDGEEIKRAERTNHHETFELNDILDMQTTWGYVEIVLLDGTVFRTDDDSCHIFFR